MHYRNCLISVYVQRLFPSWHEIPNSPISMVIFEIRQAVFRLFDGRTCLYNSSAPKYPQSLQKNVTAVILLLFILGCITASAQAPMTRFIFQILGEKAMHKYWYDSPVLSLFICHAAGNDAECSDETGSRKDSETRFCRIGRPGILPSHICRSFVNSSGDSASSDSLKLCRCLAPPESLRRCPLP